MVRQAFPEARQRMDHATRTYVYVGIAFAAVSVGVIAHSTDVSDLRNHPSPYASKIRTAYKRCARAECLFDL